MPAAPEWAPPEPGWAVVTVLGLVLPGFGLGFEIGYVLASLLGADVDSWVLTGGGVGAVLGGALCALEPPSERLAAVALVAVGAVFAAPIFGAAVWKIGASAGAAGHGLAVAVAGALLVGALYGA